MIFFDITFEKSRAVISYLFAIVFDINIVLFFYTILPKDTIPSKICGMLKIWNGTFFEKTVREVCRHICGMRSKSSSIPPCLIMARILPIWSLNTNGSFMIASIKKALHNSNQADLNNSNEQIYQNLWKSIIPQKCKFFIWSLFHEWMYQHNWTFTKETSIVELETILVSYVQNRRWRQKSSFISCPLVNGIWKNVGVLFNHSFIF